MEKLKNKIEKVCKEYFRNSTFKLDEKIFGNYIISGNNLSHAINQYKNEKKEVNVLLWFNDFWIYFEMTLVPKPKAYPKIFITLSIFEGAASDSVKTQLFRADWDNYYDEIDDNNKHPQPHWHIYPSKYKPEIIKDFEAFINIKKEETFEDSLNPEYYDNKIINIIKFHFAMNGDWAVSKKHIHFIDKDEILLDWLSGLLGHIKEQLEFINTTKC